MIVPKTICDNCQVEKKESNHWFKILLQLEGRLVLAKNGITEEEKAGREVDACGEKCVLAIASRWMETGSTVV